jgi:predicted dehydrogenase
MKRFAVIGLDHRHIYDLVAGLLDAGMSAAGYWPQSSDPHVLQGFQKRFPDIPPVAEKARLLEDPTIEVLCSSAVPNERAALAVEAMLHGKDVIVDKPGATTLAQVDDLERTVAQTGRIFSICFTERFTTPSSIVGLRIVESGEIGEVIHCLGVGPHRLNAAIRPSWFWDREAFGGILVDIASHQIDQFIAYTGFAPARVVSSTVGTFGTRPGFEDFGEMILCTDRARGYVRVDWFTPDGLPTWGDGRYFVVGTQGTIELRKYLDIEGRPGTDHLFLTTNKGTRYVNCANEPLTYFRQFLADIEARTETAMPQAHAFTVCRLALSAEANAAHFTPAQTPEHH